MIREEIQITAQAFNILPFNIEQLHQLQVNQFQQILSIVHEIWDENRARRIHVFINSSMAKPLKCCNLFGLPKLHKPGRRMRLVFPMSSYIFGPSHRFIATLINPFCFICKRTRTWKDTTKYNRIGLNKSQGQKNRERKCARPQMMRSRSTKGRRLLLWLLLGVHLKEENGTWKGRSMKCIHSSADLFP